ncbi:MAG TPA: transglutaminaseTgpA domain-containing protein, partial [Thermoanaerobaculia bacterium]|nr:transglutaminaseTgpA domain-containing protein [Thermoanaerobaculia bacterium]
MTRRAREVETLLLTMFAAVPLYFTFAIGKTSLFVFHAVMAAIVVRVLAGRGPELIPEKVMKVLAIAYLPFYFIDWKMLGGSAIAASTHLVLFIAVYQPIESLRRDNQAQRLLTTALIFVASLATSTHITVIPFVLLFAFFMFRQLMYVSHLETVRSIGRPYAEPPSGRAATFYLAGAVAIGSVLFPLLPRVRNPLVHGIMGSLPGGATALTETIDFSEQRTGNTDPTIVARVWMGQEARPFFTPVRLRGMIYDRYSRGEWQQSLRGLREVPATESGITIARPAGVQREAIVQQRATRGKIFLPVETYAISGLQARLYEGPARDTFHTYQEGPINLTVWLANRVEPLRLTRKTTLSYPVTPEVAALARSIVGDETRPERQAAMIERYMIRNFRYVPNPASMGKTLTVEEFLLRDRSGNCEYFAAGMAVLLTALDVPARIAGGFYGGRLNPLTGYYTIRREDAHAWTEVWDGARWLTFDSTPPSLRPGAVRPNPFRDYLAALGDSLTFIWDRYILTFGLGDQITLAEDLIDWAKETALAMRERLTADLAEITTPRFTSVFAALVAIGVALIVVRRRRR